MFKLLLGCKSLNSQLHRWIINICDDIMDKIMPSTPPQNNRMFLSNHSTPLKILNGAERERCCCPCCRGQRVKTAMMQQRRDPVGWGGGGAACRGVSRGKHSTSFVQVFFFPFLPHCLFVGGLLFPPLFFCLPLPVSAVSA